MSGLITSGSVGGGGVTIDSTRRFLALNSFLLEIRIDPKTGDAS